MTTEQIKKQLEARRKALSLQEGTGRRKIVKILKNEIQKYEKQLKELETAPIV